MREENLEKKKFHNPDQPRTRVTASRVSLVLRSSLISKKSQINKTRASSGATTRDFNRFSSKERRTDAGQQNHNRLPERQRLRARQSGTVLLLDFS
ncbi:hypothetical protein ElyMa_007012100 [Elysia marginata]|uniref:Uncharacterized protein n=1 Tax=Elysia marginata TaxID=1093978 RepID=A0AAV4JR74_9GAST|nr:hypothetical protein ElyMa_007012100 [Elysia marginata]